MRESVTVYAWTTPFCVTVYAWVTLTIHSFFVDNFGSCLTTPGNVGQGRLQDEPGTASLNLHLRVNEQNLFQFGLKRGLELPCLRVITAELHFQCCPRDCRGAF